MTTDKKDLYDVYVDGYHSLPRAVKRHLSLHDMQEIWHYMVRPTLEALTAAQQQEAEPFAYCFTDMSGRATMLTDGPQFSAPDDMRVITPLYLRSPAPAAQPWVPEEKDAHGPMLSTHRSYNAGWNDCRKAVLSAAPPKEGK